MLPSEEARAARFHEAVIHTASEGICVCHPAEAYPFVRFSVWNERMTEITGYTMEEINRLGWYQTVYPDPQQSERARQRMERMRQGDELRGEAWAITRKDGQGRMLSISTSMVQLEDGPAFVALMADMTEQHEALEGLK